MWATLLAGITFDDEGFVDFVSHFITSGNVLERTFELLGVDRDPARETVLLSEVKRFDDTSLLLGLFAHGDDVTGLDAVRRNVHLLAVDEDGAVADKLTGFRAGRTEAHAVDDVVKAALKELKERLAGVATTAGSSAK